MSADDSGQILLTRDAGFKMIQLGIKTFETDVWWPAAKALQSAISVNDLKTDGLKSSVDRLYGALWGAGSLISLPGIIWICIQIYEKVKK